MVTMDYYLLVDSGTVSLAQLIRIGLSYILSDSLSFMFSPSVALLLSEVNNQKNEQPLVLSLLNTFYTLLRGRMHRARLMLSG